ncbi:hypothetical protein D3C80_1492150 [compost metagenome]
MLGQVAPQAGDVARRPVRQECTEAAVLAGHVEDELGVARHALELGQVTNQALVLHQPLQVFGAHQHHLVRIEAEEHFLEGRPLGIHQAVLEPGAKHPQGQG